MVMRTRALVFAHSPRLLCMDLQKTAQVHQCRNLKTYQEVTIPFPYGHVAGKWWGDKSIQPVLGIHGWQDNAGSFDNLAPLLDIPSFLAIDLVGHGKSSHLPLGGTYRLTECAMFIRRLVENHGWKKPSFIGHSLGSIVIFLYSALYPDEVDKFVSFECSRTWYEMRNDKTPLDDMRFKIDAILAYEKKMNCTVPAYTYDDILMRYQQGLAEEPSYKSCKILLKRGLKRSPKDDNKFCFTRDPRLKMWFFCGWTPEFMKTCATKINCKVLSIRCRQSTIIVPEDKLYFDTVNLMRNCEHHEVDGNHYDHINNPENIAPIINKFFKEESQLHQCKL